MSEDKRKGEACYDRYGRNEASEVNGCGWLERVMSEIIRATVRKYGIW